MTDDLFASPKRTLERAKHHVRDLHQQVHIFLMQKPYTGVTEFDSTTTKYLHKLKLTKPFPDDFATIAADAVNNLRAVLDQIGFVVAVKTGIKNPKYTKFPFGGAIPTELDDIRARSKDIPDDIYTLFRSFKPYKGGNNLLWALNRICNTNKHKLLAPVGMDYGTGIASVTPETTSRRVQIPLPRWDSSKHEIIFAITDSEKLAPYKLQFSLDISFDEIDIVASQPVVPVLYDLARKVERILLATEAECKRLWPDKFG